MNISEWLTEFDHPDVAPWVAHPRADEVLVALVKRHLVVYSAEEREQVKRFLDRYESMIKWYE